MFLTWAKPRLIGRRREYIEAEMDAATGHSGVGSDPALARTLLPPLLLALSLLTVCLCTLTFQGKRWPRYVRLFLSPFAFWAFWDFGFGHYDLHNPRISIQVSMIACPVYAPLKVLVSQAIFCSGDIFFLWNYESGGDLFPSRRFASKVDIPSYGRGPPTSS